MRAGRRAEAQSFSSWSSLRSTLSSAEDRMVPLSASHLDVEDLVAADHLDLCRPPAALAVFELGLARLAAVLLLGSADRLAERDLCLVDRQGVVAARLQQRVGSAAKGGQAVAMTAIFEMVFMSLFS